MTDDGVVNSDAVLAVAACRRLGAVPSDRWPMVAAHLVVAGLDGADLVALASLSANVSGWEVDQLVPGLLIEIGAPACAELSGRVFADAYYANEWCCAGSQERADADALEARLAALPALDLPAGLVEALMG